MSTVVMACFKSQQNQSCSNTPHLEQVSAVEQKVPGVGSQQTQMLVSELSLITFTRQLTCQLQHLQKLRR